MSLLIIDESKCKQDGFCARECPTAIIRLKEKETFPQVISGGEQSCLQCGHCVAVCPHGALSHRLIPIKECPPIKKNLERGTGDTGKLPVPLSHDAGISEI